MRNRGYIIIGAVLLFFGLSALVSALTKFDLWALWLPLGLIALGVYVLLRPRFVKPGTGLNMKLLGDVRRREQWTAGNEEIWIGIGDVTLDFSQAALPLDETSISIYGFVGNVRLIVPEDVGLSLESTGFLTSAKILGHKTDTFLAPFKWTSDGYQSAEKRVRVDVLHFVADVAVKRS